MFVILCGIAPRNPLRFKEVPLKLGTPSDYVGWGINSDKVIKDVREVSTGMKGTQHAA